MNTSNKGIVLESQRVSLLDNCKDAFEENPKEYQFLGQVLDNRNIRVELEKIMKNSPLFSKFFQEEEEGSQSKEIKKSLSEEATKIKSKIAIEEEGKSEISTSTKTLLESHKMTGIGLLGSSVFTDLQIRGEERATISTSIISKSKFNITGLASTKSKNWKKKKQVVNENANFGSLPSVSTSPSSPQESLLASTSEGSSVWATVKNWISKFVEKIKECTNIIYHKLRKNIIEYGLLILGVALLYSAGIIVEPTFYFTLFLQTLLSFFH